MLKLLDFVDLLKNYDRVFHSVELGISSWNYNIGIITHNVVPIKVVLLMVILLINIEASDDIKNDIFYWPMRFV